MKGVIRVGDIVGPSLEGLHALSAERLQTSRVCDETIEIMDLVTATSGTNVALGQSNVELKATVLGIALTRGDIGDSIDILLFGNYEDASLAFILNDPIFLGLNGAIEQLPPIVGWQTEVGSSNGSGSIFLSIKEPIGL